MGRVNQKLLRICSVSDIENNYRTKQERNYCATEMCSVSDIFSYIFTLYAI